jgi:D-alanine-D-alanine ligase-like ATP-grasp enzyme
VSIIIRREREALSRPRILVVSRYEADAAKREKENLRFSKMVEALSVGGLEAKHVAPASMASFRREIASFAPDMTFCSFFRFPDHTDGEGYLYEAVVSEGIAWIGSPSTMMELALSKPRMKAQWRLSGIPTPDWFIVRKFQDGSIEGLEQIERAQGFPLIVKPANEGNSRGIDEGSVVRSPIELYARASLIAEEYGEALVERFVSGGDDSREFTVAMIGSGSKAIISPVEILKTVHDSAVISESDKESQTTRILSIDDARLKDKVKSLAQKVFMTSEARDYSRCDILLHEGKLYAIEMNGQPMVPDRWFEACSREAGLDEVQYINAIALAGITSNAKTGHAYISMPREMAKVLPIQVLERLTA